MGYRDELVRCAACGNQFVYTVREQRKRSARGMPTDPPPFCGDCRGADVRLSDGVLDDEYDETHDVEMEAAAGGEEPASSAPPREHWGPAASQDEEAGGARARMRSHSARRAAAGPKGSQGGQRHTSKGAGPERQPRSRGRRRSEPPAQTEIRVRQTGTVKWFDEERGFGFVAQEDGEELFVHSTSVLVDASPALTQGQEVEFEVARTSRGAQAVDVVPLD